MKQKPKPPKPKAKSRLGEQPTRESFEGWRRETFDVEALAQRGEKIIDTLIANRVPADKTTTLALVAVGLRRLADDGAPRDRLRVLRRRHGLHLRFRHQIGRAWLPRSDGVVAANA